jgi:hypothetical protein
MKNQALSFDIAFQDSTPELSRVHTLYTSGDANRDLGGCLDQELRERGIASPGATICAKSSHAYSSAPRI